MPRLDQDRGQQPRPDQPWRVQPLRQRSRLQADAGEVGAAAGQEADQRLRVPLATLAASLDDPAGRA